MKRVWDILTRLLAVHGDIQSFAYPRMSTVGSDYKLGVYYLGILTLGGIQMFENHLSSLWISFDRCDVHCKETYLNGALCRICELTRVL